MKLAKLDIEHDTAARTKARMAGGWLLKVGASPDTRPLLIEWQGQAVQRWLDARANAKAEAEQWFAIAETFARILGCTLGLFELRTAAQVKEPKEQHREVA